MNHCANCGKNFKSMTGFDKHRTGEYARPGERMGTRRCKTTEEMLTDGMFINEHGRWVTKMPTIDHIARLRSSPEQ